MAAEARAAREAAGRRGRCLMADHRAAEDRHLPHRATTTRTPSSATWPRVATRACASRAGHDPRGRGRRGRRGQPARAGAAPGSRPAASGRCCARTRSPTWWSTATSRSRPPSRTTCSSSATPTSWSRACVIAAYALQVSRVFIFLRGEFALGLERVQSGPQRRLRPRCGRPGHLRLGVLGRRGRPPRGRRLHLRRGDGAARVARGQARLPPHQAAVLPGGHRPLRRPDRGQQRRDHVQPARGS